jgi:hypothetical protein
VLSDQAAAKLRTLAGDRASQVGGLVDELPPRQAWSPECFFAKIPSGGIPARSGTTLGKAECEIYTAEPDALHSDTRELTAVLDHAGDPRKEYVCNSSTTAIDGPEAGGEEYLPIWRTKTGAWFAITS